MTVVAFRNGIMSCDSRWSSYGTQTASLIKIKRLSSGALLGQAGDNDARAIEQLLDKVKDPKKLPSRDELAATHCQFSGIIAFPRGGVYIVESARVNEAGWVVTEDDEDAESGVWPGTSMGGYCAVGSGADLALAAMDAGASARVACEIAARRNIHCSAPIHHVRLHERSGSLLNRGHVIRRHR